MRFSLTWQFILDHLDRDEGFPAREIGNWLGTSGLSASRSLIALERRGLVRHNPPLNAHQAQDFWAYGASLWYLTIAGEAKRKDPLYV